MPTPAQFTLVALSARRQARMMVCIKRFAPLKETLGGCAITRTFNAAALDTGRARLDIALVALGWGAVVGAFAIWL